MKILGIIPARGGSKGIPKKNIKKIAGKPLIAWTIEAAKKSKLISKFIVSTDSEEIKQVAEKYGASVPFLRPDQASTDDAPAFSVIKHVLSWMKENENYSPDAIIYLQPTSPLRNSRQIDEAIKKFIDTGSADNLVSVVEPPHNFHPIKLMKVEGYCISPYIEDEGINKLDRHNLPKLYARNGPAILIIKPKIIDSKRLYGQYIIPYEMDAISSIDIDNIHDFELAEYYLMKNEKNINRAS